MTRTATRLNLSDVIDDLAPPPPPCYQNRMQWMEYLKSCASTQIKRKSHKVILLQDDEPYFNFEFNFCRDCNQIQSLRMGNAGRCNPDHLKNLDPAK